MTSGHGVATLVVFILSMLFVVHPVFIPTHRPIPRIPIDLTTAPILAIALLWAAQCLDPAVIRNGIVGMDGIKPYSIIILFFSLAYMAITLDITGIFQAALYWVSIKGGRNGRKMYLYFYVMFTLLSILLGNTDPVIFSGAAYLIYYTKAAKLSSRAWIVPGFAALNTASMVLFLGNPTNVVICQGFSVNNAAFTAYTILPFLACNLFCFVVLGLQYRREIPRKVARIAHRDPYSAILDPVGAWVGGVMLCATVILCLIVSSFGIDVWLVSLPIAVGKILFDLGWDHYRHSRGIPMLGRGLPKDVTEVCEGPTVDKDPCAVEGSVYSPTSDEERPSLSPDETAAVQSRSETLNIMFQTELPPSPTLEGGVEVPRNFRRFRSYMHTLHDRLDKHFPTFINALSRLPFTHMLFVFLQFILIEALDHQGWINVFATWLVRASGNQLHPTIWLIGVAGIILCNLSGTSIGATILLTRVVHTATLPYDVNRGAAIALVVASNIGAVSFTFSASFSGLLLRAILGQKGTPLSHRDFALWNLLPLLVMTVVGLGVVSAEMAVLFQP